MKTILIILTLVFLAFASFGQGTSFPPEISIDNSALVRNDPLSAVPLDGNYLYLGDFTDIYKMDIQSPSNISYVNSPSVFEVATGDFDDSGILYFIDHYSNAAGFYSYDLQEDYLNYIANLHGPDNASFGTALAMSYYNGILYSIFSIAPWDYSASAVFSIDLATGYCTRISTGTFPGFFVALAIDRSGNFYGIDAEDGGTGKLYRIDPQAGTRTLIGDTGLNTWTYCEADFQASTGDLFFTSPIHGTYKIHKSTGVPTPISNFYGTFCAVGERSNAPMVPLDYRFVFLAFMLIAGTGIARKIWF
ncbi:MAG TPA: hypothetical protein PLK12_14020 [Prolixibacteraceae bacterium]|nr:hypothetical protein [Prolixibacteraceae bacterium]